jgi:hypothetical protein
MTQAAIGFGFEIDPFSAFWHDANIFFRRVSKCAEKRMERLYDIALIYVDIIQRLERTGDRRLLAELEEERVIWHNKFIDALRREGIPFHDREHVTRLAYFLTREPK